MGLVRCNAGAHSLSAVVLVGCSGAPLPIPRWTLRRHGAGGWSQSVHLGCSRAWRGLRRNSWESITANRKREREISEEEEEGDPCAWCEFCFDMIILQGAMFHACSYCWSNISQGDGGSVAAGASSSAAGASAASRLQESLPPPREADMKTFRHAAMTPASFAPARHNYMCCGRPMVVRWLMYSPRPPPFLITSLCDASKIGGICPVCLGMFSGASCLLRFRSHATSRAYRLFFHTAYNHLPSWGLPALLTFTFHRCSS